MLLRAGAPPSALWGEAESRGRVISSGMAYDLADKGQSDNYWGESVFPQRQRQ